MATKVLTDAYISVDSNDISSDSNQLSLSYEAETQDDTVFGDDTRSNKGGLKNWSMEISGLNDFADSAVDDILFALVGTTVTVAFRPTSDAVSASNPSYSGTGLIQSYSPVQNSIGELVGYSLSVVSAGTLSRSES
jgi:hypothetical protein